MPGWDRPAVLALWLRRLLPCLGALVNGCMAQELEPRAYSAAPIGTHFLLATYARLGGDVLTDPSLPITDVNAKIDIFALGYLQVFDLLGRTASVGVVLPYSRANVTGNVFDAPNSVYRAGVGDAYLRLAVNLLGGAAKTPAEFARHPPVSTLGASLTVVAPSGQYHADRLINIGANRWAFKPELGVSVPFGNNWFAESSFGVWFFTANDEFLGSRQRQQSPIAVVQLHGGYQFRPGLWLAADAGFYSGGNTTVDGVRNDDRRTNTRYGLTLSVPLVANWSGKIGVSKGWITRAGGDYKAITLTVQYRWND
ncbi:Putative MetA-pathway of phenol degradation [Cupriavidus sp. YR651]|uniref:transporter n=1 Tax=Cupriavidus sp. YR651 TaxID=1855315 RepID=UPI00088CD2E5|nr:transporter [Cupriavidus sp. YR651]SDD45924.1 Putative MetA-pathway of phenol degradation [Cupriavidus sp. YR651]